MTILGIIGIIIGLGFIYLCCQVAWGFISIFINISCMLIDPEYPRDKKKRNNKD